MRTVMLSSTPSDSTTLLLWLNSQTSSHTRSCYRRDAERLLVFTGKSLSAIELGDLQECSSDRAERGIHAQEADRQNRRREVMNDRCERIRREPSAENRARGHSSAEARKRGFAP